MAALLIEQALSLRASDISLDPTAQGSLTALYPGYLSFAPVDPVSNEPYNYATAGDAVSLTCPSAADQPRSAPAAHS